MNTLKCFSLLITGTLLTTATFAQNATVPITEVDVKPVVAKPIASNIPAPGARIVPVEPVAAIKPQQLIKPMAIEAPVDAALVAPSHISRVDDVTAKEIQVEKIEAVVIPFENVKQMQAKMTEQQKATMAGKTVRPKTIDQTSGATESKLTPTIAIKPIEAVKPVLTPVIEN